MPSGVYERTPKEYQKPTITSILLHLQVGEFAVFPLRVTVERTLSVISSTWGVRSVLNHMRFVNETHLLVREGAVAVQVVVTTRTA